MKKNLVINELNEVQKRCIHSIGLYSYGNRAKEISERVIEGEFDSLISENSDNHYREIVAKIWEVA